MNNETKPVTIYTTPTCVWCIKAKGFFKDHNIAYDEKNVSSDKDAAQEMIKKSGQSGVPVIVIGEGEKEELIVGFDEAKLSSALGI